MRFLLESKRDDYLNSYVELLRNKGIETNLGQLKGFLLNKFASEFGMHNLSKESNYYLAGVTRYYFEGLLTTNKRLNIFYQNFKDKPNVEVCKRLDALIEILRNAYIDSVGTKFEQPEDFGTLPLDKLLKKYGKKIDAELGLGKKEIEPTIDQSTDAGKNYTYEILYSFADATKYEEYTRPGAWCITYGKQHYDAYIKRLGGIHYVVFKQNGFENVPRRVGKNFTYKKPHDAYGNSLICVLQSNKSPEPIYITSRWNHGSHSDGTFGTEADHAYTKEEFLRVIGADESVLQRCYEQWEEGRKHATKSVSVNKVATLRKFKYAQMKISNGANIYDVFDYCRPIDLNSKNPNKSFSKVGFKIDEGTYFFSLFDKGRVLYDQVLIKTDAANICTERISENLYLVENGYVYNRRRMKILDADGIKKFKVDRFYNSMADNRYRVYAAGTKQIALLDTKREDFITDPNGHRIFEVVKPVQERMENSYRRLTNVDYRGHTFVDQVYDDCGGYVVFLYDSSSGEGYIYDLGTETFSDLPLNFKDENGEFRIDLIRSPNGYVGYSDVTKQSSYVNGQATFTFLNMQDGSRLDIEGYKFFNSLVPCCNGLVYAFRPSHNEAPKFSEYNFSGYYFYDVKLGRIITDEYGTPFASRKTYDMDKSDLVIGTDKSESLYKIYDPYTHKMVSIDGQYLFKGVRLEYTKEPSNLLSRNGKNGYFLVVNGHKIRGGQTDTIAESKTRSRKLYLTEEQFLRIFG